MDRQRFLDAQLWMRKTAAAEWSVNASGHRSLLLLPPPHSVPASASALAATVWCCFHVGSRFCFFRSSEAGEDQTQLQLELMLLQKKTRTDSAETLDYALVARFDNKYVYTVDLRQLVDIIPPLPPLTPTDPTQSTPQMDTPPPFGALQFQNASLRIWMDPQQVSHVDARQLLQSAMKRVQQCALRTRQVEKLPSETTSARRSWRDIYRHNKWLERCDRASSGGDGECTGSAAIQLTPSEFLNRARRVLKSDADFDAVKVTYRKIVTASCRRPSYSSRRRKRDREEDGQGNGDADGRYHPGDDSDDDDQREEEPFTEMELVLLLTELAHLFGEEHDGVNALLGFTATKSCTLHDRCDALRDGEASNCVTSKWQAWDEYLEVAGQVLDPKSESTEELPHREEKNARIQAAVESFQNAVVDEEDSAMWQRRTQSRRDRIHSYERMGFNTFFQDDRRRLRPLHKSGVAGVDTTTSATNLLNQPSASKEPKKQHTTTAVAQKLQQQMQVEQMFSVLLEKRKQLVRDELVFRLLPHRGSQSPMDR